MSVCHGAVDTILWSWLLLMVVLTTLWAPCGGFNVDLASNVRYDRNPNSMFGFSVVGHKEGSQGW